MSNKRGLGRGFESLIPTELIDEDFDPTHQEDLKISKLVELPVGDITPDESQPRQHFNEEALAELASSIKEYGVLQPIVVTKISNNLFQIVAGERRWRASKIAGIKTIPAIIRSLDSQRKLEISLIENLHREDLNVLEIATAYAKLRNQFNLSLVEIGQRAGGRSESAITNTMRLLKLSDAAKKIIADNNLKEGQVRPLLKASPEIIEQILPRIAAEGWSARKVEQFMVGLKSGKIANPKQPVVASPYDKDIKTIEKSLKIKAELRSSARGTGKLVLRFQNSAELDKILSKLK